MEKLNCPLCLSEDLSVLEGRYYLRSCHDCGLVFKDRSLHVSPAKEKYRYDQHKNTIEEKYLNYLNRLYQKSPVKEGLLLDFGCGPTRGLEALVKEKTHQASVDSFDPFYYPEGLSQNKYDLIFASECIEHFNSPAQEIKKIVHLLKEGGHLLVGTLLYDENTDWNSWWYLKDFTHVVFYCEKTFRWMADSYPLQLVDLGPNFSLMRRT